MIDVWHKIVCQRSKTRKRKFLLIFVKILENQTLFIIQPCWVTFTNVEQKVYFAHLVFNC